MNHECHVKMSICILDLNIFGVLPDRAVFMGSRFSSLFLRNVKCELNNLTDALYGLDVKLPA